MCNFQYFLMAVSSNFVILCVYFNQLKINAPVTFRCHIMSYIFSLMLFGWISSVVSYAQAPENSLKDSTLVENFSIYYQCDSISIDTTYLSNRRQIDRIRHYLMHSPRIDSITIYAWASPEGAYSHNKWLSRERAKSAKAFLLKSAGDSVKLNAGKIKISPLAENWIGLTKLVEDNYTRKDRSQVLKILHTKGIGNETRKWRLERLDRGWSWRYLIDNYMPELRAATWVCVWAPAPPFLPAVAAPVDSLTTESAISFPPKQPVFKEKLMIMAARTNLLVPGLNVGLEFPIKNNWSIGIDYYYPWAVSSRNRWCGEMLGLFLDAKYWFPGENYKWTKSDRLQGHAIGLYGGIGYYDYQNIREGYQGEYMDVGIDYTFGLPVGPKTNKWMRIEFNIGLGWIRTYARHYEPSDDFSQLIKDPGIKNLVFDFFGPTRASVSFLLPIRVTYTKKGGIK